MLSEKDDFTLILVQSDDEGIGILIAIPKSDINNTNYWETVGTATSDMKSTDNTRYNEVWIPGFSLEIPSTSFQLENSKIEDNEILNVC